MRNTTKAVLLAMLLGQPLNAQTHTTKSSPNTLWWMTQKGTGMSGEFEINNPKNANAALYATTNGNGYGGYFYAKGSGYGLVSETDNGIGGYFSSGSGDGVYVTSGSGYGGYFSAGGNGNGVYAQSASGNGGYFYSAGGLSNYGVYGEGGYGGYFLGHGLTGVYAECDADQASAVYGTSSNGMGGYFVNTNQNNVGLWAEGHDGGQFVSHGNGIAMHANAVDSSGLAGVFGGDVQVYGTVVADNFNQRSDARYKTHIATLPNALDTVLALRGVTYDWRTDAFPSLRFAKGRQLGFIAQEVEKTLPEIVSKDKNGYRAVDYSKVVPVLVEAIKAQQEQIKEQRQQSVAQQQQIVALQHQVRQAIRRSSEGPALGTLLLLGAGVGGGLVLQQRRRKH